MKLYLASYNIPNIEEFVEFVGLPKEQINIAVVYNAQDYKTKEERFKKYAVFQKFLRSNGLNFYDLDLRKYKNRSGKIINALSKANVLWINGGNTFLLRHVLAESGLDKLVRELLNKGLVYAGDSAGAIVAGPTLDGFERADDPSAAKRVIKEGLNLTNLIVLPHWDDPEFRPALLEIERQYRGPQYKTIRLNNNQALLINNGHWRVTL